MRPAPPSVLGALLFGAASVFAPAAHGGTTKAACIAAFDHAQEARRRGALLRAREELLVCSQQDCPGLLRADCAGVLRQVEDAQPTIVLKAVDGKGADLTAVDVELDGRKLTTVLDGRAVPVDPGRLALVFHRAPWPPVTIEIVIAEGEKSRIVSATLGPPPPPPAPVVIAPPPPALVERRDVVGWVVPGGLALIGAGMLTYAGVTRLGIGNDADHLYATCAPHCALAEYDRLSGNLTTANVALGVGIGSLALATIAWFVLAPKSRRSRAGWTSPVTTATW